jgi:hypothetical protein
MCIFSFNLNSPRLLVARLECVIFRLTVVRVSRNILAFFNALISLFFILLFPFDKSNDLLFVFALQFLYVVV